MTDRAGRAFLYSFAAVGVLLGISGTLGLLKSNEIRWYVSLGLVLNSIALIRTVRTTPPNTPAPPIDVAAIVRALIFLLAVAGGTMLVLRYKASHP
jgi:hypothetical protein